MHHIKKAVILTVGDEITTGYRKDTNSSWLSRELTSINIKVLKIVSVPDNIDSIVKFLQNTVSKKTHIDYCFVTGGLGPTNDDCTHEAVKSFLKSDDCLDENYLNLLKDWDESSASKWPEHLNKMAMKLQKVKYLPNPVGTALPMVFVKNQVTFFILPGVPFEVKEIFKQSILAKIKEGTVLSASLNFAAIMESKMHDKIRDLLDSYSNVVKFSFLPSHKGVTLRLTADKKNKKDFLKVKQQLSQRLDLNYYSENNVSMEEVVASLLIEKKVTISTAESCSRGKVGALLSSVPGSSAFYKGSIIAYSEKIKEEILKIDKDKIDKYGAVSKEVSIDMAASVAKIMKTNTSISITGVSGPDKSSDNKPVGLAYISIQYFDNSYTLELTLNAKDRDLHKSIISYVALNMLRLIICGKWKKNKNYN